MNTYLVIAAAVVSLLMAFGLYRKNASIKVEDARMREIAGYIQEGAMAYLKRQYVIMLAFSAIMFVLLLVTLDGPTAICFLVGALFSVLAGFSGMMSATRANVRTAQKAKEGMSAALNVAFSGGAVLGLLPANILDGFTEDVALIEVGHFQAARLANFIVYIFPDLFGLVFDCRLVAVVAI